MRISPISNQKATSFKAVQEGAAKKYLMSREFLQNKEKEQDKFKYFLERQSKNKFFHVCYDDISEKYIIARLMSWTKRVIPGMVDTVEDKTFQPVKEAGQVFTVREKKGYVQMIGEAKERGFEYGFDNIYEAGEVCDQYEKAENECNKRIKFVDDWDVGGTIREKYLKYCI